MVRQRRLVRVLAVALLGILSACAGVPGEGPGPALDLDRGTRRFVLPNGLTVLLQEDHRLPTATAVLAYRVGSVDDPEGGSGMAHFLEHMVFKGSERYRRGEIDQITLRSGGENNAYTTPDTTGYWFHVASTHLGDVLEILSDTMGGCTLSETEVELERGPILEEMNLTLDQPWTEMEEELDRTMYARSGYRHPVLGSRQDVERIGRAALQEHYHAYYTPEKAVLVILGDFSRAEVQRQIDRLFGPIPRGREVVRQSPEAPQDAPRSGSLWAFRSVDRFILAYRSEPAASPDAPAMDVIAALLGTGRGSKLKLRLVGREDVAGDDGILVESEPCRQDGIFSIEVALSEGASVEQARRAVEEELAELGAGSINDYELRRAKNLIRTRLAFDLGSPKELSWRMGVYEALGLPDYLSTYMDRVEAVTADDVRRLAGKTFKEKNRTLVLGAGAGRKAEGRGRSLGGPRSAGRRRACPVPLPPGTTGSPGEVREETLPNGLRLLALRRRDLPIVTLQADLEASFLNEPEGKAGLAELVSRMLNQGIRRGNPWTTTSDDIAREIEFLGGEYSLSQTGITVNLLSDHASIGLDLLRDLLRNPALPEDRLVHVREDQAANLDLQEENPQDVARRLFLEAAYGDHPLARPPAGRKKTLAGLTFEDVKSFHRRYYRPENVILAVVGDVDPDWALRQMRSRFESWKGEGPWTPPQIARAVRQKKPRSIHEAARARQARIHLGHVGIERAHPDYVALKVMETILGSSPGFTSRLAHSIRDEMGLAYDVTGSVTEEAGLSAGPFQVVLGVDPAKKERALLAVLEILRTFQKEGPTDEELSDAKRYLVGSFSSQWETVEDSASYLLLTRRYGLGADYAADFEAAVGRVTKEDVLRVARKHIDLEALTIVVVERRSPWVIALEVLGGALLVLGLVLILRRRRRRARVVARTMVP